jgi:hypothetical protein
MVLPPPLFKSSIDGVGLMEMRRKSAFLTQIQGFFATVIAVVATFGPGNRHKDMKKRQRLSFKIFQTP